MALTGAPPKSFSSRFISHNREKSLPSPLAINALDFCSVFGRRLPEKSVGVAIGSSSNTYHAELLWEFI